MADKFFQNFPEIQYRLNDGNVIYIKDFFRKSKFEQESLHRVLNYTYYELDDGDARPDILATKLYGNSDLHWTFFLVNEIENYYDWYKDFETFENYINKKYPGQYAVGSASTNIVSAKSNSADKTNKFLLGEKVTSVSSEGRVILVEPDSNRIAIEGGEFVANEAITGKISTKSFTPTSVINQRDGVAYYKNDNLRSNTEVSGYTATTYYDEEWKKNESKRNIKIISPGIIDSVVKSFEKVMLS
tara:strand:+ start:1230 stop:1961 length:732 start_codon:yes stop_codon:yes gene_type:complete